MDCPEKSIRFYGDPMDKARKTAQIKRSMFSFAR